MNPMTKKELAEYAREIRGRQTGVYRLDDDERAGVERGLADMRAGRFAADDRIAAIFQRARSFRAREFATAAGETEGTAKVFRRRMG
jgi:hypothetical protein